MDKTNQTSYPEGGHATCFQVEDDSFWFRHRNECISALVRCFGVSGKFVDIGGGNGFVARRLADDGHDVALVEPGAEGARNAREFRGIKQVIQGTLAGAMTELRSVVAAGAFDVVEHIEDDRGFVGQIADLLPDGGMFYSTVPAHAWLWSMADDEAGHFRRYTLASYQALLSEHFDVQFASYFFGPLVAPIAIFRSLPYRLGRRGGATENVAREHGTSGGLATKAMTAMLEHEVSRIGALRPMRFGASLIVAARKKTIGCVTLLRRVNRGQ
jgi:SAM-dependent methyltransferase